MILLPKSSSLYWTKHAQAKMAYYKLSQNRVKRVINSPLRIEEGIAPGTIAYMQPTSYKTKNGKKAWNQEIWVMVDKNKNDSKVKIISAWRYPGMTKPKSQLPKLILNEIQEALFSINED
jgi:hypothetical protein